MSNLPNWSGAAVVYRRVQMINIERAKRAGKCPDDITDDDECAVFNDDGTLSAEFLELIR